MYRLHDKEERLLKTRGGKKGLNNLREIFIEEKDITVNEEYKNELDITT